MIRPASRALIQSTVRPTAFPPARAIARRRFLSTDPAHLKSRGWKSSALRWGLAAAGIYYYNTSPVFAEQPQHNLLNPNVDALEDGNLPDTLDALTASSRRKAQKDASVLQSTIETTSNIDAMESSSHPATDIPAIDASPTELEEEAEGQGAFNPVTGEINWDCPCLGGMAHGPCGPEFREAFSCFVYSTEEPKGMDCIDKFQNMQNCFRAHPDVYKGELEDDEELDAELAQEREDLSNQIADRKAAERDQQTQSGNRLLEEAEAAPHTDTETSKSTASKPAKQNSSNKRSSKSTAKNSSTKDEHQLPNAKSTTSSEPQPEMSEDYKAHNKGQNPRAPPSEGNQVEPTSVIKDEPVPKAAHDATNAPTPDGKQLTK